MKRFAVLLLFSSLFIFGCLNAPQSTNNSSIISAPKPVQVDTSTMKHYSNSGYGISFYYPADWDLAPEYINKIAVSDFDANKTIVLIRKNSDVSINMIMIAINDSEMTEICVTNVWLCDNAFLSSNLTDNDVAYDKRIDSGVEIVAGKRAYFFTHDIRYKPMTISYEGELTNITTNSSLDRIKVVLVSNNNVTFGIIFSSQSDEFLKNKGDFDAILSTIEFSG